MQYIATAALVWMAVSLYFISRDFTAFKNRDDIHRIANALAFPRAQDVLVEFRYEDKDLLINALNSYRRNKPRAKKEQVQPAE